MKGLSHMLTLETKLPTRTLKPSTGDCRPRGGWDDLTPQDWSPLTCAVRKSGAGRDQSSIWSLANLAIKVRRI